MNSRSGSSNLKSSRICSIECGRLGEALMVDRLFKSLLLRPRQKLEEPEYNTDIGDQIINVHRTGALAAQRSAGCRVFRLGIEFETAMIHQHMNEGKTDALSTHPESNGNLERWLSVLTQRTARPVAIETPKVRGTILRRSSAVSRQFAWEVQPNWIKGESRHSAWLVLQKEFTQAKDPSRIERESILVGLQCIILLTAIVRSLQ
ncbi:hypothetical protein FB45DRAFT_872483 [Roridomyces roridus]|uniref:Uncharacterized protein n=1 Tax=Roridomyces roridus TaxID=1738132 RepID=A0AAD7BE75_9AGAR|nr:hypothetical protein FB45DRAFT_872483 [Roridomyces roridus]